MALKEAREAAQEIAEKFAQGCWHEDEFIYARLQHISRRVVRDVVKSGLVCYVSWTHVPSHSFLDPGSWKWWCWTPEPHFFWVDGIGKLKEWMLWEVSITRQQLLWMEAFLAAYEVRMFHQILKFKHEAAAYLHMRSAERHKLFEQLAVACRASDSSGRRYVRMLSAPALGEEAQRRRDGALRLGTFLQ